MDNPVVLITGALTGIGRAAAVAFAEQGANVVVAGRRDEAGNTLAEELRSLGSEAEFINADVRNDDDVRALVDKTVARFGRLDVAVNNAGTEGQVGPITDQTADTYAATFDTNVLGVILSMKHEVRAMQKQGSGSIINVSSTYGHEGAAGASVYVGSKHAVEGISKSVALELVNSGIRVNVVAPGTTDTGMLTRFTGTPENKAGLVATVPMQRLGRPQEIAAGIVFIASDAASYITGHVLNVDGGLTQQLTPPPGPAGSQFVKPIIGGAMTSQSTPSADPATDAAPSSAADSAEHTHNSAPTRFVEADGTRFAYRRFGNPGGTPIVLLQHFMGNLDNYDPAITDALAAGREVILTDNAGVGLSTGTAPETVPAMARDAASLIDALGLEHVDLFGFSMGGFVAQQIVIDRPELVRRIVLVGTGPRGGEGIGQPDPDVAPLFSTPYDPQDLMWLPIFFSPSGKSQAAGREFLERIRERTEDRDVPVSQATVTAHLAAAGDWGIAAPEGYDHLKRICHPALVVNGSNDIIVATVNSYILQQNLPNAELILFPDSNHGSHFQFTQAFNRYLAEFLDR